MDSGTKGLRRAPALVQASVPLRRALTVDHLQLHAPDGPVRLHPTPPADPVIPAWVAGRPLEAAPRTDDFGATMKVWVVMYAAYGDLWANIVYSSEEAAKAFVGDRPEYGIESVEIGEQP